MVVSLSVTALLVAPSPALAHPFTGGPSTPAQVAIAVAGAFATLLGVVMMLRSRGAERVGRKWPIVTVAGLFAFVVGPDLVAPAAPSCIDLDRPVGIEVIRPDEGERVAGPEVALEIDLDGGRIGAPGATQNVAGEGQVHLMVDGEVASIAGAEAQMLELSPGRHTIEVEYVANDHTPFCRPVQDRVSFEVAAANSPGR